MCWGDVNVVMDNREHSRRGEASQNQEHVEFQEFIYDMRLRFASDW